MRFALALLAVCLTCVAPAQLKDVRKGYWNIQASYPTFKNRSATAIAANRDARAREKRAFDSFLAQAKKDLPELKQMNSAAEYQLLITPTVSLDSAQFCTGYVTRYDFTGGAHGNTTYDALNYSPAGKNLKLQDLFLPGHDARTLCSAALVKQLKAQKLGSMVQDGQWTMLDQDQMKRFVITKSGLLFLFNSYDLGAYVEGAIKCVVPYKSLTGLNPKLFGTLLPSQKSDSLVGGTWVLESIQYNNDETLVAESGGKYELTFEANGRVSGRAGANRVTGTYTIKNDVITFGQLAATRMADPPNSIASRYLKDLTSCRSYLFKDGKLYFQLPYDSGVIAFQKIK